MFLLCSQRISFELSELVRHWALLTTDCYEKGQLICLNGTGIMLNSHSKTGSLLSVSESYLVSIRDTFIDVRWNWKSSLAEISVPADPAVPRLLLDYTAGDFILKRRKSVLEAGPFGLNYLKHL